MNSGKVVTIPAEDVTMGDWHGTGYIVTNPETGAGAYMISGGLNGGSSSFIVYMKYLAGVIGKVGNIFMVIAGIVGLLSFAWIPGVDLLIAGMVLMLILAIEDYVNYIDEYSRYLQTGDYRLEQQIEWEAQWSVTSFALNLVLLYWFWAVFDTPVPEEPVDGIIEGEGGTGSGGESGGTPEGGAGEGVPIPGESGQYFHEQNLEGLNEIKNHLMNDVDGFDYKPNEAMLNKIEEILSDSQELTGAYKDFYDHELTESALMKQGYSYNDAHNMALEIHGVQPQALYSPEVVKEYYKWFNKNDYEYWGITIEK